MAAEDQRCLVSVYVPITDLSGEMVYTLGEITFPVTVGDGIREHTDLIDFLVFPARSEYNMIFGRTALGLLAVWVSTAHGLMMILIPRGVAKVWADKECCSVLQKEFPPPANEYKDERWIICSNFPE
jgi:preprotein translocase subunit Sss1